MYWPDTQTGVDVQPARKPVASAVRKFFTEGGVGQPPTVPGGDWFNQITNEVLNVLAAAGINPSKVDDDQLLQAIQALNIAGLTLEGVLEEAPSWADVPAYKDGGPSGNMNAQAQALLNRQEKFRDELAGNSGADNISFVRSTISGAVKRALSEWVRDSYISLGELGKDDGVFDNGPAIATIAALGKGLYIPNPAVSWLISTPVILPSGFKVLGENMMTALIEIGADITPLTVNTYSEISGIRLKKKAGVTHTKNGIDVGTLTVSGARSTIERVYIDGMGNDGIQVRNGNLGCIRDVVSISNGRDGIHFTKETPDNNAWKLEGFLDLRSNARDGLNLESGSSKGDAYAPKTISADLVCAQQNGRYGVYIGTRTNNMVIYAEANGTADIFLDTHAWGNNVVVVEAASLVETTPSVNRISYHNKDADYIRCERGQLQLTGALNGGLKINDDDNTSGYFKIEKVAQRSFVFKFGGSGAQQDIAFVNEQPFKINVAFGGDIFPSTDNAYRTGLSSNRWSIVYAATGTINTSDAREKTAPLPIDDMVLDAWGDVQLVAFKWLEAIASKGEDTARWHHGVIAQQVRDAFIAHGLDGCDYGLLCYDEWEDKFEPLFDEEGNTTGQVTQTLVAGNRWGIRPDQCLFLEAAYQRRRSDRIEARLAVLEAK